MFNPSPGSDVPAFVRSGVRLLRFKHTVFRIFEQGCLVFIISKHCTKEKKEIRLHLCIGDTVTFRFQITGELDSGFAKLIYFPFGIYYCTLYLILRGRT